MRVKAVVLALALMTSLVSLAKTVWRVGVFDGPSGDVVVNGHTANVQPQKKWTLFLVPHVHFDVGYTPLSP